MPFDTRPLGIPIAEIGIRVFIGAVECQDELLLNVLPGNEIQA